MKTSTWILGIILALAIIFAYYMAYGQTPVEHAYVIPGKTAFEWKFVDASRVWLSVNYVGGADWNKEGYHPGFTCVISQYKPIVKQLPSGQYEITFTSEITKNLP